MNENLEQLGQKFSESEYRALLSALDQTALVSMTDARGNIRYANERFVEVSKYSLVELIGQNHRILKSHHQSDELFADLWQRITAGEVWRGELKNRAKDGSYYWVDTSIAPIMGTHGKPDRYISVRFLITDKKHRMQQLEESRAKADAILSSIGEGLILFDDEGRVERVNWAAQRMLGFEEHELSNQRFSKLVTAVDEKGKVIPVSKRPFQRALRDNQTISTDMSYKRRDGTIFPARINVAPVTLNDEVIGLVEIFRDVTRDHELEKAKDEFVSLTSHQLRTPLTAIRLFGEMLADELPGPLNSDQREYLDKIQESTHRMIRLVGDILNISRIETGRLVVDAQPTNLRVLIESHLAEIEPLIKEKDVTVTIKLSKNFPILIPLDRNLFGQVIHNLLTNALRYTQPGKGKIMINCKTSSHGFEISVRDNGIGIPLVVQPRIFERFFRADNATLAVSDGTGLGLYLVKMIIEHSGGKLWFESKEGKGTTFYVCLPKGGMQQGKPKGSSQ